jgi:two-component system sensor histidine kinase CpxA
MRSLFLKIFLWFWATQVVIALAVATILSLSIQPEILASRWRSTAGDAVALYAESAAEVYERAGAKGEADFLTRLESTSRIHATLRNEKGAILAGHERLNADDVVSQAGGSNQAEFHVEENVALGAKRVQSASGRTYIFVVEMPRNAPRPFSPFFFILPRGPLTVTRWIVSILISGLICYWLTRYLTRPILRLRVAAGQISGGDLGARAEARLAKRRDEFGELVRDFNTMAGRIESLVAAQRQLLSDISHELRSPLARLSLALELARQRSGADAAGPLDRIEREAERLNELIGNLLTIARLDGKAPEPRPEIVDLSYLVHEVASDAEFEARARDCVVNVAVAEECAVQGNPELLRSAVENVVRNAVRYTTPGTAVEIALTRSSDKPGRAVITVRDHGPGVPDVELVKVFQPFYRVASGRERSSGGVGLGLAITKRAVDLHHGSVMARNAEGGGLRIDITLPIVGGGHDSARTPQESVQQA